MQISVILPAYNAEKTLLRAIKSTIRGLRPHDELIVIDDASCDATPELLAGLLDPRIKVIRNSENKGLANSLNLAIEAASHETIARMDADDICLPWRFEVQRRVFASKRPDLLFGAVIFSTRHFTLPMVHTFVNRYLPGSLARALAVSCLLAHPTMMGSRAALTSLGGYRNVVAEDYDLWLRAARAGKLFMRHWAPVIIYRKTSDSLSATDSKRADHLLHLETLQGELFESQLSQINHEDSLVAMRRYRKELIWRDPLLRLETGVLSDPLAQRGGRNEEN